MEKSHLFPLDNFIQALELREIRNECRFNMTNNKNYISLIQQLIWYFKIYKKENKKNNIYCYLFNWEERDVGYALVKNSENKYWITGGLKADARGKGLGKILFNEILQTIKDNEIWLEVLDSNIAAKKIYTKLGFRNIRKKKMNGENVTIMKLERK